MVDLEPVRGAEQGKVRPAVVIQNEIGNRFSPTIIVAAITTGKHAPIYQLTQHRRSYKGHISTHRARLPFPLYDAKILFMFMLDNNKVLR